MPKYFHDLLSSWVKYRPWVWMLVIDKVWNRFMRNLLKRSPTTRNFIQRYDSCTGANAWGRKVRAGVGWADRV